MHRPTAELLERHGIRASAQRIAIADFVLTTATHPTAEQALAEARRRCPKVSRATVYNTLNLLENVGLLRHFELGLGRVMFDPNTEAHHHFVDDVTGAVFDLPPETLEVRDHGLPPDLEVREFQVVVRGRRADPHNHASPSGSGGPT